MKDNDIIMLQKQLAYEQVKNEKLTADLDYVAMMTDVVIPTEEGSDEQPQS